jgi:hypothetical protein
VEETPLRGAAAEAAVAVEGAVPVEVEVEVGEAEGPEADADAREEAPANAGLPAGNEDGAPLEVMLGEGGEGSVEVIVEPGRMGGGPWAGVDEEGALRVLKAAAVSVEFGGGEEPGKVVEDVFKHCFTVSL